MSYKPIVTNKARVSRLAAFAIIALFAAHGILATDAAAQFLNDRYVATTGSDQNGTNSCLSAPVPCRTIQHAINQASTGAAIRIFDGVYTEPLQVTAKSVSFVRQGSGTVVIEAASQPGAVNARVVTIVGPARVSFNDMTLRNGTASGSQDGGGILCINNCSIHLTNTQVHSNNAGGTGGGIHIAGGDVASTFAGSVIGINQADGDGGGIYVEDGAIVFVENSRLRNNLSSGNGGGIAAVNSTITMDNANIGGAGTTDGNTAALRGGGLYANGESVVLDNVEVRSNVAGDRGGGIDLLNVEATIRGTAFRLNHADTSGGGVYIRGGNADVLINDATFLLNTALKSGGGMVATSAAALEMSNTVFQSNQAAVQGGGLWLAVDAQLRGVEFRSNTIDRPADLPGEFTCGGGLYAIDGSPTLDSLVVTGNVAGAGDRGASGGGMCFENTGASISNSVISENLASGTVASGGGIRLFDDDMTLTNVVVADNGVKTVGTTVSSLKSRGGGIVVFGSDASPTFVNATIVGNTIDADTMSAGGGIYVDKSALLLNTIVWGNSAFADPDVSIFTGGVLQFDYSLAGVLPGGGGLLQPENMIVGDPMLVDPDNGDFRLGMGSPAIDGGHPTISPALYPGGPDNPVDFAGNPRFTDGRIDIGAIESTGTSTHVDSGVGGSVFSVGAPYPNPTRDIATVLVETDRVRDVRLVVYDAIGREVRVAFGGALAGGEQRRVTFSMAGLPAGLYFARLHVAGLAPATRALTVIR